MDNRGYKYNGWSRLFNEYLNLGSVIPSKYNFVEDYVDDKLKEIVLMQQLRKQSVYNWKTMRLIRHRLINVAEEAGLIWKTEELK